MTKRILIDGVYPEEVRVVNCDNNQVEEYDYDTIAKKQLRSNLNLAKITRVEPSLQATFVDYIDLRHIFIPFYEIHPDYYIPLNEDGTMQDVADDFNLRKMLENKTFNIQPLVPEDETPPETIPEIREHNQIVDQPAPEIFDVIDANSQESSAENANILEFDEFGEEIEPVSEDAESLALKKYKIQDVIRKNQIIVVQVMKEERGNKGASITTYLSLAGRYAVLMPNSMRSGGISRRISNIDDRRRIRDLIENLGLPNGAGVIIRTAGADRSNAEIKRDFNYLVNLWNNIKEAIDNASTVPIFLHAEGDVIKRCIRDNYDSTIGEIIIQGESSYKAARDFMSIFMPDHAEKIKHYKGKVPLFVRFDVEDQIANMHDATVTLKSGGYLVINHTEALVAIDVNSGKATSEKNVEETALKTNMEAAVEIAKQMKVRDLSGLVVVDFIDMLEPKNRASVENALRGALQSDKAKIHLSRISPLGLLEISRQRLKPSFQESNTVVCSHCSGKGRVRAIETMAINIMRAVETELSRGDYDEVNVYASPDNIVYLLNNYRVDIDRISNRFRTKIMFQIDYLMQSDQYSIDKVRRSPYLYYDSPREIDAYANSDGESNYNKNKRQKKWRNNYKDKNQNNQSQEEPAAAKVEHEPISLIEPITSTSNVEMIEDEVKTTKAGGYRKPNRRNNRRKFKRRNNKEGGGMQNSGKEPELVGAEGKKDDSPSLLRGLWKKIID